MSLFYKPVVLPKLHLRLKVSSMWTSQQWQHQTQEKGALRTPRWQWGWSGRPRKRWWSAALLRWLTPSPSLPRLVQCHFLSLLAGNGASDQCAWDSLDTSSICVCVLASQQVFLTCMLLGSFLIPLHYKPSLSGTPNTVEILMRRCPICHDMLLTCYEDKQQIGSTFHTNVTNKFYMAIGLTSLNHILCASSSLLV